MPVTYSSGLVNALHGKRNFAGSIEVVDLGGKIILDHQGEPILVTWALRTTGEGSQSVRDTVWEAGEMMQKERSERMRGLHGSSLALKVEKGPSAKKWGQTASGCRELLCHQCEDSRTSVLQEEPKSANTPYGLGSEFSPRISRKELSPANILILVCEPRPEKPMSPARLPTHRSMSGSVSAGFAAECVVSSSSINRKHMQLELSPQHWTLRYSQRLPPKLLEPERLWTRICTWQAAFWMWEWSLFV